MNAPLRVLMVEDSEDDAELVLRELRRGPYELTWERVQTADAMQAALGRDAWDLVLSDFAMPNFSAPAALAILQETGLDIPFMVISGTIGEEAAVGALKAGANDFLVKGRLARLHPAIERELREARVRRARREAEHRLQASELRFRRLAESGVVGIVVREDGGAILEANDAFLATVGRSRADLVAGRLRWTEILAEEYQERGAAAEAEVRAQGAAQPWETEFVHPDGGRTPALVGSARLEGSRSLALSVDLTAQKKAEKALRKSEDQLRQAQKMEAIGNLAGGVAHDFNNVLTVILSYTEMLLARPDTGDAALGDLREVRAAGARAAELTRQLLAFSRKQILQPRVVNLNEVVRGMEGMLRRLIGEDIDFSVAGAPALGKVEADPGQLEQVVMNLVVNARDAMQSGGSLRIETADEHLDERYTQAHEDLEPGDYVKISVSDTGTGMDKATQARIFEPFFTTKEQGKGTGLGLSTVFGIVKQSRGHIAVDSRLGAGTTFSVYLPRTTHTGQTTISPPSEVITLRGSETILLVEDDEQVRRVTSSILRRREYQVLEARNGKEGFETARKYKDRIKLVLTDVVMPQMSGAQFVKDLATILSTLKVIFMSGYTDDLIAHHGVLDPGIVFLQKPITPELLLRKVRETLDG